LKKVLITGGSGLLALNWSVSIRDKFNVTLGLHKRNVSLNGVSSYFLNLENNQNLEESIDELKPEIIIHTAGLTSIEQCEARPDLARKINVDLASNLATVCAQRNIIFVHISTDNFFPGCYELATETTVPNPVNEYGRTKALAETSVLDINPDALVIRTNFYGWGPSYRSSFSDTIISRLKIGDELNLFEDVFYTPILIDSLVSVVHDLIELNANGIFNVVADEQLSKYEFGLMLARLFKLDSDLIKPSRLSEQTDLVRRPKEMGLSNKKVSNLLDKRLGGIEEHITRLIEQEKSGFAKEIIEL
jgi:dTDP-4-dehydrorhamnose reductase